MTAAAKAAAGGRAGGHHCQPSDIAQRPTKVDCALGLGKPEGLMSGVRCGVVEQ